MNVCKECGSTYSEQYCPQCTFDATKTTLLGLKQAVDMALIETQKLRANVESALLGLETLLKIVTVKLNDLGEE
jgi:hypothetical protein